jgi:hypothetical protein
MNALISDKSKLIHMEDGSILYGRLDGQHVKLRGVTKEERRPGEASMADLVQGEQTCLHGSSKQGTF